VREVYHQIEQPKKRLPQWNGQIKFVEKHLLDPLKWGPVKMHTANCGKTLLGSQAACTCPNRRAETRPRRIFVNSMSDLFHENVTDEMRDRIYAVMGLCPQHTFQVLTKRPERRLEYLGNSATMQRVREAMIGFQLGQINLKRTGVPVSEWSGMPLPNVWEGVSIEDQPTADKRVPLLLQTPAAVRFTSAEPLLGAIDITSHAIPAMWTGQLHWVIVGGESGPDARPMHPDWARSLRDQCKAAGVPFFFKQWGEFTSEQCPGVEVVLDTLKPGQCVTSGIKGHHTLYTRVGKKLAGALLDGVEYREFPEVRA
jgi:protein gp37